MHVSYIIKHTNKERGFLEKKFLEQLRRKIVLSLKYLILFKHQLYIFFTFFDFRSWGIKWNRAFAISFSMFEITEITASKYKTSDGRIDPCLFLKCFWIIRRGNLVAIYRSPWVAPLLAVITLWGFFPPAIFWLPICSDKSNYCEMQEMAQAGARASFGRGQWAA